ncbi:MAG: RnfABCDGE type electron transport complex subunit B [Proteobacteria bacterium]|nr:RnfABCDGE type electron transport complex subunit B [Pseudomonadota bacterium]NOG59837.1 RnfABCDGE type electron transport complex subunit B [Pseudomonadota bacterium]
MLSLFIAITVISLFAISIAILSSNNESPIIEKTNQNKIEAIEKVLPQTQCGDCSFNGCQPYAEALAQNKTDINRCLPGGDETVKELAVLLGTKIKPLYKESKDTNIVALIDESICIGCVKCISACPVDAILGAPKQMHSIINQYCTGCELCIAPCPVDCISMVKAS